MISLMRKLGLILLVIVGRPVYASGQANMPMPLCLKLRSSVWDTTPGGWVGEKFHSIPTSIRLDTLVRQSGFGGGAFVLSPTMKTGGRDVAFWSRVAENRFALTWTNGFTGVGMWLEARGDSLVGTAEARSDLLGGGFPKATVVAVPISCPDSIAKQLPKMD